MATETYELTTRIWRRITAAGESGTCWVTELQDNTSIKINHTVDGGADTIAADGGAAEIAAGLDDHDDAYPLTFDDGAISIPADNANDIYYALYIDNTPSTVNTAKITADVI